jgi:hypothetical protein
MEEENALDNRIDKILRLIERCRYGVHDISRTELNKKRLPRFNMPFELGIFFAARRFGNKRQKTKNAIVFERRKYSYQQYLFYLNGVDIHSYQNSYREAIRGIRNWLRTTSKRKTIPGDSTIVKDFREFRKKSPGIAKKIGFDSIGKVPFNDYCTLVEEAIKNKLPETKAEKPKPRPDSRYTGMINVQ